jgi:hypothetical protein
MGFNGGSGFGFGLLSNCGGFQVGGGGGGWFGFW